MLKLNQLAGFVSGVKREPIIEEYTGANTTWVVPAGVTSATFNVWGGKGSANGGVSTGTIAVTPGETLYLQIGGNSVGDTGGQNGGGAGGYAFVDAGPDTEGDGGGGYSGVFRTSVAWANALIVAGGGGGRGRASAKFGSGASGSGGAGGGTTGVAGTNAVSAIGGVAGTQSSGYAQLTGGPGGDSVNSETDNAAAGGGGGGGYYGGGGGGASTSSTHAYGAGGGGGSGYIIGTATDTTMTTGTSTSGKIVITY